MYLTISSMKDPVSGGDGNCGDIDSEAATKKFVTLTKPCVWSTSGIGGSNIIEEHKGPRPSELCLLFLLYDAYTFWPKPKSGQLFFTGAQLELKLNSGSRDTIWRVRDNRPSWKTNCILSYNHNHNKTCKNNKHGGAMIVVIVVSALVGTNPTTQK